MLKFTLALEITLLVVGSGAVAATAGEPTSRPQPATTIRAAEPSTPTARSILPQSSTITPTATYKYEGPPEVVIELELIESVGEKTELMARPMVHVIAGQDAQLRWWYGLNRERMLSLKLTPRVVDAFFAADTDPCASRAAVPCHSDATCRTIARSESATRSPIQPVSGEQPTSNVSADADDELDHDAPPRVLATPESAAGSQTVSREGLDAEQRLLNALQRRISLDFESAAFTEVMKAIATRCGVNISIDPDALAEEGLTIESPVTIAGSGLRLCTVLDRILAPSDLDYVIEDEVISITSRQRARGEFVTVSYAVSDLLRPNGDDKTRIDKAAAGRLIGKIIAEASPESWDVVGGPGAIRVFETTGSIVVRQTRDVHDEICQALERMRRARSLDVAE